MPDHVHLLVEGLGEGSDFQQFVRNWKQRTAFRFKHEHGGTLWHRGYYEHILRNDESVESKAAYLLANPARAGLVKTSAEYAWIGSFVTTLEDLLIRAQNPENGRGRP